MSSKVKDTEHIFQKYIFELVLQHSANWDQKIKGEGPDMTENGGIHDGTQSSSV